MAEIKFTQGHFEALAEAIQEAKRTAQTCEPYGADAAQSELLRGAFLDGINMLQGEIASMARRSNGRFDAGRFGRACELGANVRNKTR